MYWKQVVQLGNMTVIKIEWTTWKKTAQTPTAHHENKHPKCSFSNIFHNVLENKAITGKANKYLQSDS